MSRKSYSDGEPQNDAVADAWVRARLRLQSQLGEDVFVSWFGRLELGSVAEGTAHLSVPTRFLKNWIQSHYSDRILDVLSAELPAVKRLAVCERPSSRPCGGSKAMLTDSSPAPLAALAGAEPAHELDDVLSAPLRIAGPRTGDEDFQVMDGLSGSPLDRRLSFATFLIGRPNQLAHAAAFRSSSLTT